MRRLILIVYVLNSLFAIAQGCHSDLLLKKGSIGGASALVTTSGSVRICAEGLTTVPCNTSGINLFSDSALTKPISNPVPTDPNGNYTWCATNGTYTQQPSGSGIVTKSFGSVTIALSKFSLLLTGNNNFIGANTFTKFNGLTMRGQTLNTFGDSITNGQGATSSATYYVNLIGTSNGWTINNPAVRGDMLFDQCRYIYGVTPAAPAAALTSVTNLTLSSFLIGQNDAGNATNNMDSWQSAYTACAAFLLIPNKITGQSSVATRTGTWTNSDLYPTLGTKTTTATDTFSTSVYGSVIYLATQTTTSCTNNFNVSIDGVDMGTFTQRTPFTTTHGISTAPQLLRFGNLLNGSHTVVVTNNSGSCTLYIDWLAGPQGQQNINGPFLFAATPYQTQVPATTDLIAHMVKNSIATLAQDGLGAILTDLESYCGPGTSNLCNGADGTHPNDAGEQVIANAFLNDMTVLHGYANRQMSNWLRNIANPSTNETELIEACAGIRGGIACDTFDRVDTTGGLGTSTSGYNWLVRAGTLGIANHQAYGTIAGNNWATIDAGSGDASVSVQWAILPVLGSGSQMWIPFRVQDVNSYWRLGLPTGSHTMTLQKIVAGSPSGTQPTFSTVATNDIIKVTTAGSTIAVYVNGKLRGTYVDSTYSTSTAFGIQFNDTATRVGYFALSTGNKAASNCLQLPCVVASDTKTAQSANINATQLLASSVGGRYRLTAYLKVTQAATTSSALPNVAFLQCTDPIDSTVTNAQASLPANAGNGLSTANGGSVLCDSKAGTTISYGTLGYTTVGATGMQFKSYVVLERVQ